MIWMESVVKSKEGKKSRRYSAEGEANKQFSLTEAFKETYSTYGTKTVVSLEDEDLPTSVLELKNTLQKQLAITFMCL